jgi:hypothetical protein
MNPPAYPTLLVPSEIGIELRNALLNARRSRLERLLERAPLRLLNLLNREIVGRLARVTARRKLLQTVAVQGQAPPEFTIVDGACGLLAIRLLTEHLDANARRHANPTVSQQERWETSNTVQLLSDYLGQTTARPTSAMAEPTR